MRKSKKTFNINLNLKSDEGFREYLKECIDEQFGSYVKRKIGEVVQKEANRLLKNNPYNITRGIDNEIHKQVNSLISKSQTQGVFDGFVKNKVDKEVAKVFYKTATKAIDKYIKGNSWKKQIDDLARAKILSMAAKGK